LNTLTRKYKKRKCFTHARTPHRKPRSRRSSRRLGRYPGARGGSAGVRFGRNVPRLGQSAAALPEYTPRTPALCSAERLRHHFNGRVRSAVHHRGVPKLICCIIRPVASAIVCGEWASRRCRLRSLRLDWLSFPFPSKHLFVEWLLHRNCHPCRLLLDGAGLGLRLRLNTESASNWSAVITCNI
jgi:hypothetical protein